MVAGTEQQRETTSSAVPDPSIRHLTDQLRARAMEFGTYAKYLVSLQIDRFKLTATRLVVYAILGTAALAVAGAVLIFGPACCCLGSPG